MNSAQLLPIGYSETADHRAIRKIPSEAWQEIFKWTLVGQPPFDISQTQEGPWLLGLEEIKQWKSARIMAHRSILELISEEYTESNEACGYPTETAQVLELIDLMAFDDTQGLWMWSREVFRDAPRLHLVRLLGVFTKEIPWEQLTDLCIGKVIFSDVLNILSRCHRLRRLRLPRGFATEAKLAHSENSRSEDSAVTGPEHKEAESVPEERGSTGGMRRSKIVLADLRELELFDTEILPHLHAPSSKVLTIKATLVFDPDTALDDFTTLSDFLTSCSTIRVLDVVISGFDANSLAEAFPLMPEV
ncbi:hypothetical protein EDD18DRAFT_1346636 [Armillaria luteobubalina]|uniref:Uncharacterized protein n=1 Tax=Armillaria luteobubalina TaxID=153913 RepID=A0AA39UXL8_9AGAR|nr:hypothetical protein EDD18DRAFT_1346636 [Armillaria luteobubalina]